MNPNFNLLDTVVGDRVLNAAAINAILGEESGSIINTSITTAGAGTLTAAALVGGQIARTGPTAAYSDTTDTASNIVTALGGFTAGETFLARLKNSTKYTQTLLGGTGVTISGNALVPGFGIANYFGTVGGTAAAPTVVFTHINSSAVYLQGEVTNPQVTALTTVGAGAITAAGIVSGITVRGGTQTAVFTDTVDTAANIIAAMTAPQTINASFYYTYVNNTVFPATLTGAAGGVTVSGATVVAANSWVKYLVTYTAANTMTMVAVEQGYFPKTGTFVANGASAVTVSDARLTANSNVIITLNTVGGSVGAIPHLATVTPGTGFTVVGSASDTSTYNYTILG